MEGTTLEVHDRGTDLGLLQGYWRDVDCLDRGDRGQRREPEGVVAQSTA